MSVTTTRPAVRTTKPNLVDRSGLTESDWALIRVDQAFRDAHYAAEDAAACDRKLARLDTLLDDPTLRVEHPPNHPDRIAAEVRHAELANERERHRREFKLAAKEAGTAWLLLPKNDAQWFVEGLAFSWSDSPAFALALPDVALNRSVFWQSVIRAWQASPKEGSSCPF